MARKSLAALAKPVTKEPRITIPKSLWIGAGGIVTIAVIVLVLILSGNNSEKPSSLVVSAPTSMPGGKAVAPTSTKTPVKTNTPKPPTATQSINEYADPTMYDDFNNSSYDGKLNSSLWGITGDTSFGSFRQENGYAVLAVNEYKHIIGASVAKSANYDSNPIFVEAKLMLDADTTKNGTDHGMHFQTSDGYSVCSIFADGNKQGISCWSNYFGVDQRNYHVEISPSTWHTMRIEAYPEQMMFVYLVDNQEIGSYVYEKTERWKNMEYELNIRMNNWGSSAKDPRGYVDYVRMGAIEDDPKYIFYDHFSLQKYDGSYDRTKWKTAYNDSGGKIFQEDGLLVLQQRGPEKGQMLGALRLNPIGSLLPENRYSYFEIKMMVDDSTINKGSLGLSFTTNKTYFACELDGNSGGVAKNCWTEELPGNLNYASIFRYTGNRNTWYVFKLKIDPFERKIIFYIDKKEIASYSLEDEESLPIGFGLGCYVAQENDFQGYIDYVKLYANDE